VPENKLHFWALFIYLYMNNKDNKLIVDVYKEAIKKNLDKKKSAKILTKRLSKILNKYLE
jgi:hypothetical protein|tara:strand:+ start:229 stop:408 length:180 start_codon:yes stop_codon:yes gene_type:complete